MISGLRVLAMVPARSGSKGLPGKNVLPFGGKPLLAWPIEAARASLYVDEVVLSTDSAEFARIGEAHGARVPALRPAELATDTSPSIDFILHMIDLLEAGGERFDYLVLLEPTSPLTEASDIDAALERLVDAADRADSLAGMAAVHNAHPDFLLRREEDGLLRPYATEEFGGPKRRQELEPVYALDGSLYMSTVDAIRRKRGFYHDRTIGFEMPRYKAFEIDDLVDFICVEAIWRNLHRLADGQAT